MKYVFSVSLWRESPELTRWTILGKIKSSGACTMTRQGCFRPVLTNCNNYQATPQLAIEFGLSTLEGQLLTFVDYDKDQAIKMLEPQLERQLKQLEQIKEIEASK